MIIKVFYHDKCFDGACSASLFTRFYRERIRPHAEFQYQGLLHRAGALFNIEDFTGDGKPDIACIGASTGNLKLYVNLGR